LDGQPKNITGRYACLTTPDSLLTTQSSNLEVGPVLLYLWVMEERLLTYLTEKLTQTLGSGFKITGKDHIGGGCISQSLKLKTSYGDFFLKWNASAADDLFVKEAECLKELKKLSRKRLVIPGVILAEQAGELPGFIVLEFLETGYSQRQEENLGLGLAALHQYQDQKFGFYHDNYCGATLQKNDWCEDWREFFVSNRLIYILELVDKSRHLGMEDKKVYDALVKKLPDWLPASSKVSLIHGDLWSGNYLYTTGGPALIDPASYFADREMELSIMLMFGGFSERTWKAYHDTLPPEYGWEERIPVYQLYHILNHYYLFGGSYGQQALSVAKKFVR